MPVGRFKFMAAGEGLRARAARGSAWTLGGYALGQGLRFLSNLAISWILAETTDDPTRIFGLMFYVSTVLQGVQLFSDLGIGASLVHDRRGEDEGFLRTAFTVQATRGLLLWGVVVALAVPVALRYDEPLLRWLLPVAGLTAIIGGLGSTARYRANRQLNLRGLTILTLGAQVASTVTIITWVLVWPTVWAFIAGSIATSLTNTIGSHFLLRDRHDRFGFDREAFGRLIRFGRWVFLATALTFLTGSLDKLLFPELIGFERLGVYFFAVTIVRVIVVAGDRLADRVLFPALAEVARERPKKFRSRLQQARLAVLGPVASGLLLLYLGGEVFVRLVYAEVYHSAGWMLQVAALGAIVTSVGRTYSSAWLARGDSFSHMCMMAASFIALVVTAVGGFHIAGERGFIVGLAAAGLVSYPAIAVLAARRGMWQWKVDGAILGGAGLIVAIAEAIGLGVRWA